MGVYYSLYTEVFIDGEWKCACERMEQYSTGRMKLIPTMWGQSYLRETYDKVEREGTMIKFEELSAQVQGLYKRDDNGCESGEFYPHDYATFYAISLNKLRSMISENRKHEMSGYVWKQYVYDYESGDLEDIYEYLNPYEYSQLPNDEKVAYMYYEWDSVDGWYANIGRILEHVRWQLYGFEDVNYKYTDDYQVRIICIRE